MPKGSIPRKGSRTSQVLSNQASLAKSPVGRQRAAKAANEWNEYRNAGHDTPALRKSMKDVRSNDSVGGAGARINENPVKALKRRLKGL